MSAVLPSWENILEQGKVLALAERFEDALLYFRLAMREARQAGMPALVQRHIVDCVVDALEMRGDHDDVLEALDLSLQAYAEEPPTTLLQQADRVALLTRRGAVLLKAGERSAATEALEKVGMSHRVNHYPSQLSGGQQQRVAVARALSGKPSILLADEPTGNLDPDTADRVFGVLMDLVRDTRLAALSQAEAALMRAVAAGFRPASWGEEKGRELGMGGWMDAGWMRRTGLCIALRAKRGHA